MSNPCPKKKKKSDLKTLATTYAIWKLSAAKKSVQRQQSQTNSFKKKKKEKKVIKPKLANHSILGKRCSPAVRRLSHQRF